MTPAQRERLARALEDELRASEAGRTANPVTPAVRNEGFLTDALLAAQAAGDDAAVLVADSNAFSTYNTLVGEARGDEAIARTTLALNRVAVRLDAIYAGRGVRFVAGRKAGDEVYLLGLPEGGGDRRLPDAVALDMTRVLHEEIAAENAGASMPIPTATSSAKVVRPDAYQGRLGLSRLLDEVDHLGVAAFNGPGSVWAKNGGLVRMADGEDRILPGPTYPLDAGHQLPAFRGNQGALAGDPALAYEEERRRNVVRADGTAERRRNLVRADGTARPQLLPLPAPDAAEPGPATGPAALRRALAGAPDLATVDWADPEKSAQAITTLEDAIQRARRETPVESTFRFLAQDGIEVLNQGVGLARLDATIEAAAREGGSATLEFFEPRGLKAINDRGFVLEGEEGEAVPVPVSHGGGDAVVEAMARANHAALVEVLGEGYQQSGAAFTFRDRGKRFANAYGHSVAPEAVREVERRRDALYAASPAEVVGADGRPRAILMPREGGSYAFRQSLGYATASLDPNLAGMDAEALRLRLVGPIGEGGVSVLDVGKLLADGDREAPLDLVPTSLPGLTFWTSPLREASDNVNRRTP